MRVAVVGTGLMGRPMAERLLGSGYKVTVFNRTRAKMEPLRVSGAEIAGSAQEAIEWAECVILILTDAAAIRNVLFSQVGGPDLRGRTVIQMGTIGVAESIALGKQMTKKGGDYLEAPVLGSIPEAERGNLLVMVGGAQTQFARWSGLLQCFGEKLIFIGEVGKASALKLAMNQLIGSLTAAFALSLGFVQRHGVEVDQFMEILRQSALYAPTFDKKLKRMLNRDFDYPNFPTKHLAKDAELFRKEAESVCLDVSGLDGIRRLLGSAIEGGLGEKDYSALFEAVNPV